MNFKIALLVITLCVNVQAYAKMPLPEGSELNVEAFINTGSIELVSGERGNGTKVALYVINDYPQVENELQDAGYEIKKLCDDVVQFSMNIEGVIQSAYILKGQNVVDIITKDAAIADFYRDYFKDFCQ